MKQKLIFFSGATLVFPVFITMNFQIFRGGLNDYEFSLPLSIAFCLCVFINGLLNFINSLRRPIPALFLFFIFVMFCISEIITNFGNPSLLALYLFFSFLGFFLPWCLTIQTDEQITSLFNGVYYSLTLAAFLHVSDSFYSFGIKGAFVVRGVDCVFGIFSIYQKFIYFSTLLAIGSYLAMRQGNGLKKYLSLTVLLTDIIMIGAREALILVLFFYIVNGISLKKHWDFKIIYGLVYLLSGFLLLTAFYYLGHLYFPETALIAKIGTLVEGGDRSGLSAGRYNAIRQIISTFDIDLPFIFLGNGFSTVTGNLATPHNQYIEWFLRGGLFYLSFNLVFLLYATTQMLRSKRYPLVTIGYILLSILLISNNINTPFRAPYISIFLWMIIGISCRALSLRQVNFIPPKLLRLQVEN